MNRVAKQQIGLMFTACQLLSLTHTLILCVGVIQPHDILVVLLIVKSNIISHACISFSLYLTMDASCAVLLVFPLCVFSGAARAGDSDHRAGDGQHGHVSRATTAEWQNDQDGVTNPFIQQVEMHKHQQSIALLNQ